MENILLLAVSFFVGILLRHVQVLPENAPRSLNAFIIYVSLPALTLLYVHELSLTVDLWVPAAMPWLFFGCSALLIWILAKKMHWSRTTIGCLLLTAGLGNTSFVGLPMIEAYYGKEGLGIGLIADQAGSFMVLSTFGLFTAAAFSGGKVSARDIAGRIIRFPPFSCAVLALLLHEVNYPAPINWVLERLGQTLTPIALVSVGLQLRVTGLRSELGPLSWGLTLKMLIVPALIWVFFCALGSHSLILNVTVFEAAMPPMITGGIIAMEYELNPRLAALMLGVGIPLGFLTLAGWWNLLRLFQ